jgi:hypothetical protein
VCVCVCVWTLIPGEHATHEPRRAKVPGTRRIEPECRRVETEGQ